MNLLVKTKISVLFIFMNNLQVFKTKEKNCSQAVYYHSDHLDSTAQMPHCRNLPKAILKINIATLIIPLNVCITAQSAK